MIANGGRSLKREGRGQLLRQFHRGCDRLSLDSLTLLAILNPVQSGTQT